MYKEIFFTNVRRLLETLGMSKQDLVEASGVSASYLADIIAGKANPSLHSMEVIAQALGVPLPALLDATDLDPETLRELSGNEATLSVPVGYKRVVAILPVHQAFLVEKWGMEAAKKISQK